MIAAAKAGGITLEGSGFRTYEHQKEIYDSRGCPCPGLVATPGNSNHERGLAIDFTSGGSLLGDNDPEHKWLDSNGKKYGFLPYSREAWHYSMSGS
jgi:LAS superfamily LD-carboxypeptidase LdcB